MTNDKERTTSLDDLFGDFAELVLENVTIELDELKIALRPMVQQMARTVAGPALEMPRSLIPASFKAPFGEYTQSIQEITIGATKGQGGSRGSTITIGGHTAPAWDLFQAPPKHLPVITADVFDMPISLAKVVKTHYKEVLDDPAEWAKLVVNKFGADAVTLHLISTDRALGDTSPNDAAKVIEDVLQAVKVPVIIGSAGDPEKDGPVLAKAAEVCEGERTLLCSATVDVYEEVAIAAKKHDQVVLSWTSIDINQQKELNRRLFEWLTPEQIVIDPTTAALGYGLEYAFTIMQRMRLAGLLGDAELRFPISSGTTNAWAAREAWLNNPELGPRELRGPIWESVTALALLLAGNDLFMMMHPAAIKTLHDLVGWMKERQKVKSEEYPDWTSLSIPEGT
ncbi:MAG: CO dehydrogenase/acetyl-CoA synthase subunit delta [Candidatus Thorarchaeota archaeon]|nr:MAG: CO dehydrogenase/acetyl-CoA synthase subunit delta [Candidatus Thorarchaeota archaeon]